MKTKYWKFPRIDGSVGAPSLSRGLPPTRNNSIYVKTIFFTGLTKWTLHQNLVSWWHVEVWSRTLNRIFRWLITLGAHFAYKDDISFVFSVFHPFNIQREEQILNLEILFHIKQKNLFCFDTFKSICEHWTTSSYQKLY